MFDFDPIQIVILVIGVVGSLIHTFWEKRKQNADVQSPPKAADPLDEFFERPTKPQTPRKQSTEKRIQLQPTLPVAPQLPPLPAVDLPAPAPKKSAKKLNRGFIRQAFLWREVLGPPKSLQSETDTSITVARKPQVRTNTKPVW
jgi:hypothetical protein